MLHTIQAIDLAVFQYLNGFANQSAISDSLIRFLASSLAYVLVGVLAIVGLWPKRRIRMVVTALASGAVARGVIKPIILLFWERARPYIALATAQTVFPGMVPPSEDYQSFPSGHAIFFFALATAIYHYDKKLGWVFFAGATLMGIARVAAGVHWPSDIIGGAGIGILTALAVTRSMRYLMRGRVTKA